MQHGGDFYFNSRPSARGDGRSVRKGRSVGISIHAPPRGATSGIVTLRGITNDFNSRPSARGDARRQEEPLDGQIFQFTPLREGRLAASTLAFLFGISIHAPPRGATRLNHEYPHPEDFNSRPSARGDEIAEKQDMSAGISIHAPPRGATRKKM